MCVARKFLSRWIKTTFTPLCISPANLSEYAELTAQNMQKKKSVPTFPTFPYRQLGSQGCDRSYSKFQFPGRYGHLKKN